MPLLLGVQTCALDRKSTRLNSSHTIISYAVFCLKKTAAMSLGWMLRTASQIERAVETRPFSTKDLTSFTAEETRPATPGTRPLTDENAPSNRPATNAAPPIAKSSIACSFPRAFDQRPPVIEPDLTTPFSFCAKSSLGIQIR